MIIDMSASMVAVGKLRMHANRGERIPQGWMIDEDGRPVYDPSAFFADPKRGAILPLGGTLAGYKGFALGLLVDILAGALGGAGCSTGVDKADCGNGIFVLVIDPKEFSTREDFAERVEGFVSTVKGSKKAPGVEEIMVPGERALRSRRARAEKGIPVDLPTWERITDLLNELGIERKYGPP